jgi:alanyl-tRNA synthetase
MKRLYWQDTYLMQHQSIITALGQDEHGFYLRLNETIFHPQGGGQPSDEGTINGAKIIKLKDLRNINEINHYVEDIRQFKESDTAELMIDKDKRLTYAALHTAGHITGGVLRTAYNYEDQTAANHFPNQAKVEFISAGELEKETLEQQVNAIIVDARKVTEEYSESGLHCNCRFMDRTLFWHTS